MAFPDSITVFTTLVDNVDTVLAAHPNERGSEITNVETALGANLRNVLYAGYISGITPSINGTDSTNDIDFTTGECRDVADADDIIISSALTKQIDASFGEGTNQGMMDSGSIGASAVSVAIFAIGDSTRVKDPDIVATLSSPSTGPTMPSGFDTKRYLYSLYWNGSSWEYFTCMGEGRTRSFYFRSTVSLLSAGSQTSYTDVDCSSIVPAGYCNAIEVQSNNNTSNSTTSLYVRPNGSSQDDRHNMFDRGTGAGDPPGAQTGTIYLDDSAIFEYKVTGNSFNINLRGYEVNA